MLKWHFRALTAALALCAACSQPPQKPALHEKIEPKSEIQFPQKPDFAAIAADAAPVNGVYTTWGLAFNQANLLGQTVRVRGKIVEVSPDCPALTQPRTRAAKRKAMKRHDADDGAKKCLGLSVKINSPDDKNAPLRITGYHPFYHPHLKPGMEMDVTGKFLRSTNFLGMPAVEADDGLIHAIELRGMGVDKDGNFTTDPAKISDLIAKGQLVEIPKQWTMERLNNGQ